MPKNSLTGDLGARKATSMSAKNIEKKEKRLRHTAAGGDVKEETSQGNPKAASKRLETAGALGVLSVANPRAIHTAAK